MSRKSLFQKSFPKVFDLLKQKLSVKVELNQILETSFKIASCGA